MSYGTLQALYGRDYLHLYVIYNISNSFKLGTSAPLRAAHTRKWKDKGYNYVSPNVKMFP